MTRGRNDRAHNHLCTTTAPHLAKIQQWAPACPSAPPTTQDLCTPHFLGGGTRIQCAPGHPMAQSLCVSTTSLSPAFLPYSHPYRLPTTIRTSPPPFLTSGNPAVRSISLPNFSILVKQCRHPPFLFSPYHLRPDHNDNARTVCFITQDAHPLDDHPCHAL